MIEALLAAGRDDWRAIIGALEQAYGRAPQAQRIELSGPGEGPIELDRRTASLSDVLSVLRASGALDNLDEAA